MTLQRYWCSSTVTLGLLATSLAWACTPASYERTVEQPETPSATSAAIAPRGHDAPARQVIVFVWDGLRPDSVTPEHTPVLAKMRDERGVNFLDHHAVFPTFTMMNGAAFATGAYPSTHGFYGNTEYQPGPSGKDASGRSVDFTQPVFTEDYGILQALDQYYADLDGSGLFDVGTLFAAAHRAGLTTAVVGKNGPAFLQDVRHDDTRSVILDENVAFPLWFAGDLQRQGFALPVNSSRYPFADGSLTLRDDNGSPTATTSSRVVLLSDGATSDPRAAGGSPYDAKNEYLMDVFVRYILPRLQPELSVIWLRNPDSTEHVFGPGTPNTLDALRAQDVLLGRLLDTVRRLGREARADIIVVSDHGHSTVAGDPDFFPLRELTGAADGSGAVGELAANGYSVSGDVRTADLLTRAGFAHVYDGDGCIYDPVLSGIRTDGSRIYPTRIDADGSICGTPGAKYSTPSFQVPATLPPDAVIVAANGGADYLYVPGQDEGLVRRLVVALQERPVYGAIFVRSAHGSIEGTLPLTAIDAEGTRRGSPPTPDIVVSFAWDDQAVTAANRDVPGTEYESAQNNRGMHGSFSPADVHNTLVAVGPDFKRGFVSHYPSGNVDVAPTVASLLGLSLPHASGRVLEEALHDHSATYSVESTQLRAATTVDRSCRPDDPDCSRPSGATRYEMTLRRKTVRQGPQGASYTYFDEAGATRTSATLHDGK